MVVKAGQSYTRHRATSLPHHNNITFGHDSRPSELKVRFLFYTIDQLAVFNYLFLKSSLVLVFFCLSKYFMIDNKSECNKILSVFQQCELN